jgi:hypothetical protein
MRLFFRTLLSRIEITTEIKERKKYFSVGIVVGAFKSILFYLTNSDSQCLAGHCLLAT